MKTVHLTDVNATLHVREEEPPLPVTRAGLETVVIQGSLRSGKRTTHTFFTTWAKWAQHYKVGFSPQGEDYTIVRRLLRKYSLEELTERAETFWYQQSEPLTTGAYPHHMRLFAAKLKEQG